MSESQNTRRDFMKTAGIGAAALSLPGCSALKGLTGKKAQTAIPRWRGFNILNFFLATSTGERSDMMTKEDDFRWMSDWGFDFIRLPMSYPLWLQRKYQSGDKINVPDIYKINESALEKIDRTIELGQQYGIHVNLNFHRGPGFCVNNELIEPFDLWVDKEALDAFMFHWDTLAQRYKGIPTSQLSFDLVNEPVAPGTGTMTRTRYTKVARETTKKIREANPDRLVIVDGLDYGNLAVPELIPLGVAQSTHAYTPGVISHFKAPWHSAGFRATEAKWPGAVDENGEVWDRKRLELLYAPWIDLAKQGIGVHCGECGSYKLLPHDVFLAWFRDVMEILTDANIGYSLWEFRGEFGILNSGRPDVAYEDWYGHKLDRKLLALLQEF